MKKRRTGVQSKEEIIEEAISRYISRVGGDRDGYIATLLRGLIREGSIPPKLLDSVPVRAAQAGKTRFDQAYDAASYLAFPSYSDNTLKKLFGPIEGDKETRLWKVMLPKRFKIAYAVVRATNFQDAFALGCDYACRVSLRLYHVIPEDLTVRVVFMSDSSVRRYLRVNMSNRKIRMNKRSQKKERTVTAKQINGARICALGHPPGDPNRHIARYSDKKDLLRILHESEKVKTSKVITESFMKKTPFEEDSDDPV